MALYPRSAAVILAVALGCAGCADFTSINETREDRHGFSLSGARLTIDSDGTDLRLVPGTGDSVEVERSLTGKATVDGNASWSLADGVLRLRVTCSGFVPDCGARHTVHVPAGVTAVEVASDGPVRAVGLTADLTAEVTSSWLRVEEPAGALRLQADQNIAVTTARSTDVTATSSERGVKVTFASPPRLVEATASNGSVTVTVPDGPETYRVTTTPGKPGMRSDPASRRTITATAGRTANVRKAN